MLEEELVPRTIRVPQMWSLIIGSNLLITLSQLDLQEVIADSILLERKTLGDTPGVYTVRIVDETNVYRYHIVIDKDCNYAVGAREFLKHAAALALSSESDLSTYSLVNENGDLVSPSDWLSFLQTGEVEDRVFGLRTQAAQANTSSDEYRAFTMKLLMDVPNKPYRIKEKSIQSRNFEENGHAESKALTIYHPPEPRTSKQKESHHSDGNDMKSLVVFDPRRLPVRKQSAEAHRRPEEKSVTLRSTMPKAAQTSLKAIPELYEIENEVTETDLFADERMSVFNHTPAGPASHPGSFKPGYTRTLGEFVGASKQDAKAGVSEADKEIRESSHGEKRLSFPRLGTGPPIADVPTHDCAAPSGDEPTEPRSVSEKSSMSDTNQQFREEGSSEFPLRIASPIKPRIVPFLTWRLSWRDDERNDMDVEKNLKQILDRLDRSLRSRVVGSTYLGGLSSTPATVAGKLVALCSEPDKTPDSFMFDAGDTELNSGSPFAEMMMSQDVQDQHYHK
ncbi:hypothetical protein BDP55DRAFT_143871 [Colletotrichum godetiae]|uniref:Uncharacterized protein n=1 Tax=Colletotrichum godetiae TaxID=1209918 RepID=A0AAJ0EZ16_9PEZI|nr:uncharacterized protein BDP55DRAFT_143871 [Colletotrichum godetiae]KAK1700767.1 hypothetical protein BDP55DRAFT_143871 [Colletotrichum godetiae]